jgi:hypothetical protein
VTWARENGYTGLSWDEADAWGIAEAARREVELGEFFKRDGRVIFDPHGADADHDRR